VAILILRIVFAEHNIENEIDWMDHIGEEEGVLYQIPRKTQVDPKCRFMLVALQSFVRLLLFRD
jgi:hypothetical protein